MIINGAASLRPVPPERYRGLAGRPQPLDQLRARIGIRRQADLDLGLFYRRACRGTKASIDLAVRTACWPSATAAVPAPAGGQHGDGRIALAKRRGAVEARREISRRGE